MRLKNKVFKLGPVRIRAKSGKIEYPQELAGKWAFVVSFWTQDGETLLKEEAPVGSFETQKEAIKESKIAARFISEEFQKHFDGKVNGKYIDMKNGGILRDWDEH